VADRTTTARERIRVAIEQWVGISEALTPDEVDRLAEVVDRGLYPNGHEDTPAHWRANAAEEKRKKQHVSGLLGEACREVAKHREDVARLDHLHRLDHSLADQRERELERLRMEVRLLARSRLLTLDRAAGVVQGHGYEIGELHVPQAADILRGLAAGPRGT